MEMCMHNEILQRICEGVASMVGEFDNPYIQELFSKISCGKMLRSRLILTIAGESEESIKLCSIIELIQLASLLHDDVIDEAMKRRGVDSLNALYGNKNAIMLGDVLYSKAYYHLLSLPTKVAKCVANSVCLLSSGEIRDVFMAKSFNPSMQEYILMIEEKTASLIASSAKASASLIGEDEEAYHHYGLCLGIAFQIIDDVLDITQSEQVLGKPSMNDFREGKTTLPYIKLYHSLPESEQERLISLHNKDLNNEQKKWLFESFEKYGSIKESMKIAKQYAQSATSKLQKGYNPKLDEMIEAVIQRSF